MKTWCSTCINAMVALAATALLAGCGPSTPEEYLAAARKELARNDRATAEIQLRNALQKNPDLGEARYLLGKTLLDNREPAAAEKELRRAAGLGYTSDQTYPALARAMLMLGQTKKLIEEFGTTKLASPDGMADLKTTLGLAILAQGDTSAAQVAFTAARAASPDYPRAYLGEAFIKSGAGDAKGALELVDKALAKAPDLAEAWQLKGGLLSAQDQADAALVAYRKAIEIDRKDLVSHSAAIATLLRQGKVDEAAKQLEAMKQVAPKHAQTHYLQARLAYAQKNFAAANEAIQQHLKLAPNSFSGLLLGGAIDLQRRAHAQAEAKLLKALGAAPRHRHATRLLLATYADSEQSTKAMSLLRPILPAIENDPELLTLAGTIFMQHGDIDDGIAYFAKAAALDPKSTRNRTAIALAHLLKGDTATALVELEEAAAVDPGTQADMALIATLFRQRQPEKAITAIDALEKKLATSPIPANLRGAALLMKGDKAGARRSFDQALSRDPAFYPALGSLVALDMTEKKPDEARKRLESFVAKNPGSARALIALAKLRAQKGGSADEVGTLLSKAVAADPADETARLALIEHYLRNKEPAKAASAAQDALAASPDNAKLADALGRALVAAGDRNQAIAIYRKLAQTSSGSVLPHLRLAELYVAMQENDKALQSLQEALKIRPDLVQAQRGVIALDLDSGRLKQAVAMAREVQKQRPKQSVGYILEGEIHASRKAWNEAIDAFRRGLAQAGTVDVAVRLHEALRASGKPAEADKLAVTWFKDHPNDLGFRKYLGISASLRRDYAAAAQHYRILVEARPNDALLLNDLAFYAGQVRDPKAVDYAERAYKLAPSDPIVMDTLGVLLVEKGDVARGVELLRSASEKAPQSNLIRLNLAKALIKAGQKDAAKKELEVLERLGTNYSAHAEVAQLMKTL